MALFEHASPRHLANERPRHLEGLIR